MEKGKWFSVMGWNVEIRNGNNHTYEYKNFLKEEGFKYIKTSKYCHHWYAHFNHEPVEYKEICKRLGLTYTIYEDRYKRNSDYRSAFFESNKPIFNRYYICGYCGSLIKKDQVSVDHIIPVKKTKRYPLYRCIMKMLKINNVNDTRNLVASCYRCNSRKSSNGGSWCIRGFLGKHILWWIVYYAFLIVAIIFLFYIVLR